MQVSMFLKMSEGDPWLGMRSWEETQREWPQEKAGNITGPSYDN